MRNEIKILIAAIVVIIIVLVGAFALGGNKSEQASITPTPVAVTATPTPTPVPIGGGQGGAATPTAVVSAAPSVTPVPTVTPNPSPESGVKQTEFGYWITYPPLGPETWSSPHAAPDQGVPNNTVFFNPTSASLTVDYLNDDQSDYRVNATLYRLGDLNGSTTVHVHVDTSDNVWEDSLGTWYDLYLNGDYNHYLGVPDFTVTFAPHVSSMKITIVDEGLDQRNVVEGVNAMAASNLGDLKLTITGVDGGYTYGYNDQYTLNFVSAHSEPDHKVTFDSQGGYVDAPFADTSLKATANTIDWDYSDSISSVTDDGTWAYIHIPLHRYTDNNVPYTTGDQVVHVYVEGDQPFQDNAVITQPHFSEGSSTADLIVKLPVSDMQDDSGEISFYIEQGDYLIQPYPGFDLDLNENMG